MEFLANFFIGGFGAFFGAACAFFFEWTKERKNEEAKQHAAITKALLTLMGNLNSLWNLRELIEPYRNMQNRECRIGFLYSVSNKERVDINSLSFLMEFADAQLMLELQLANNRYQTTFDAFDLRNKMLKELDESRHEAVGEDGKKDTAVSPGAALRVKNATDALFRSVDLSIMEIDAVTKALREHGLNLFREKRLPDFVLGEEGRELGDAAKARGYRL